MTSNLNELIARRNELTTRKQQTENDLAKIKSILADIDIMHEINNKINECQNLAHKIKNFQIDEQLSCHVRSNLSDMEYTFPEPFVGHMTRIDKARWEYRSQSNRYYNILKSIETELTQLNEQIDNIVQQAKNGDIDAIYDILDSNIESDVKIECSRKLLKIKDSMRFFQTINQLINHRPPLF